MTTTLPDVESLAKELAGNHRHFSCFIWDGRPEDDEDWAVVYTHHRDSGLLDQSNAAVFERVLSPFMEGDHPHVVPETHRHWAVGWIEGFRIRVYWHGRITRAFRAYAELHFREKQYPVLDEEDYSWWEHEATMENIDDAAWKLQKEYALPEGWQRAVYDWLSDNNDSAIENVDDRGGCPSEDELRQAFEALGYKKEE